MNVDALDGAKNLAIETGHAMFRKFDDRNRPAIAVFHMDDVRRAYGITEATAGTLL
jgi:hypothetical protein